MATMIGHNIALLEPVSPVELSNYLAEANIDVIERADELAGGAERCAVNDDDTAGRATLLVKQIIEATKAATDRQRTAKKPYQELADVAFDFFKPVLVQLAEAKHKALTKLDQFRRERERIAAEERAKAEAEARRAAEEAAKATDLDAAFEAEQRAQAAVVAQTVKAPEIRSAYGHLATERKTWVYEVTDMAAVPRQFLMLNDAAVKAHIKARQKDHPPAPVPGIAFKEQSVTVVR